MELLSCCGVSQNPPWTRGGMSRSTCPSESLIFGRPEINASGPDDLVLTEHAQSLKSPRRQIGVLGHGHMFEDWILISSGSDIIS